MIVEHIGDVNRYFSDGGDWVIDVAANGTEIQIVIIPQTGSLEFASGTNVDNLGAFIAAVKADCIAAGMNWSGN